MPSHRSLLVALVTLAMLAFVVPAPVAAAEPAPGDGLTTVTPPPPEVVAVPADPAPDPQPVSVPDPPPPPTPEPEPELDPAPAPAPAPGVPEAPSPTAPAEAAPPPAAGTGGAAEVPAGSISLPGPPASPAPTLPWAYAQQPTPAELEPGLRVLGGLATQADGSAVLYGGEQWTGDGTHGDTWVWRDGVWAKVCGGAANPYFLRYSSECAPGVRSGHAMASGPGGVFLYGGAGTVMGSPGSPANPTADTWRFDGATWNEVTTDTNPGVRVMAAMAGNAAEILLFGGLTTTSGYGSLFGPPGPGFEMSDDTWRFDGTNWSQVCGVSMGSTCGPSARVGSAMAWDGANLVLFGGEAVESGNAVALADTWIWTGSAWSAICGTAGNPACAPGGRTMASLTQLVAPDPAWSGAFMTGGSPLAASRDRPGESLLWADAWFWSARDHTWSALSVPWPSSDPSCNLVSDLSCTPATSPVFTTTTTLPGSCQVLVTGTTLTGTLSGGAATRRTYVAGWDWNLDGAPDSCPLSSTLPPPGTPVADTPGTRRSSPDAGDGGSTTVTDAPGAAVPTTPAASGPVPSRIGPRHTPRRSLQASAARGTLTGGGRALPQWLWWATAGVLAGLLGLLWLALLLLWRRRDDSDAEDALAEDGDVAPGKAGEDALGEAAATEG